jgi:hypothetical protein
MHAKISNPIRNENGSLVKWFGADGRQFRNSRKSAPSREWVTCEDIGNEFQFKVSCDTFV